MNFGGNGTANHPKLPPWNKGMKNCYSAETLNKIKAANTGRHLSEVSRKRISEAHRGRHLTEEHRQHISEGQIGKTHSDEARKRMSEAHKGKPLSEKHKKSLKGLCSKPVLMYSRAGDFIKEFSSITSAAMYLGIKHPNVSRVLTGKRKSVRGYTFRYKNENPDR